MVGIEGMRTFSGADDLFSGAARDYRAVAGFEGWGSRRCQPALDLKRFIRMKKTLKESGLEMVEPDAELQLAKFRAPYEPF